MHRPLLFVSPIVPDATGNGLAIRAALVLEQLSRHHNVSLLVLPPQGVTYKTTLDAARTLASNLHPMRNDRRSESGGPAAVHLYRTVGLSAALPWLLQVPREDRAIDLDEVESATHRRMADVYERDSHWRAKFHRVEARALERVERALFGAFHRVYVCSDRERAALPDRAMRNAVRVVPNVLPEIVVPDGAAGDAPFTFLFVGTLGYPANADALAWFCGRVMPLLRVRTSVPFRVVAIASGAAPDLADLVRAAGVELRDAVADVAGGYREAHAVVAPLRLGGGTRLKVIEAMRACRPIVSTTEGVAGLALRHEEQVLVGDVPETFAAQCVRLIHEPALRSRLAAAAREVYLRDHVPMAMARALDAALADARSTGGGPQAPAFLPR